MIRSSEGIKLGVLVLRNPLDYKRDGNGIKIQSLKLLPKCLSKFKLISLTEVSFLPSSSSVTRGRNDSDTDKLKE